VDQTLKILERARAWVTEDERVRAALVHGSVAKGELTPLSDLDLIIVTEPGQRDAIWAEREQLTRRLLGAVPAQTNEVAHQRPYRWQARTADLDMLDLTVDEGAVDVWIGLAGPVDFLVDRAEVRVGFERAMAALSPPPAYDPTSECDGTWALFAWLTGLLLHRRTLYARIGLNDLITRRMVPLLDRSPYTIGTVDDPDDRALTDRLDLAFPRSGEPAEMARALRASADWYADLLSDWSTRTGRPRPSSALESAVFAALDRSSASHDR
jgi:predicted nucleotidyltransferase